MNPSECPSGGQNKLREDRCVCTVSVVLNFSPCYAMFLQFKLKIVYFRSLCCMLVTVFQGRELKEQSAVRFVGKSMAGTQKVAASTQMREQHDTALGR